MEPKGIGTTVRGSKREGDEGIEAMERRRRSGLKRIGGGNERDGKAKGIVTRGRGRRR